MNLISLIGGWLKFYFIRRRADQLQVKYQNSPSIC